MTSCKELVQLFENIGGKIECNYETKQCVLYPQNIKCDFEKYDGVYFDSVLEKFSHNGQWRTHITDLPLKKNTTPPIKYHNFQKASAGGFRIQFNRKVDKIEDINV
jgi:hypothetical protein